MTTEWDFLPLGSVVTINGSDHPLMIISRALLVDTDDGPRYFDYATCLYPEGLIGDAVAYIQGKDVNEVVSRGYSDEREEEYGKQMAGILEERGYPIGAPAEEGR